ncbi:MAG: alkaline phosphatase D family protein [Ferruginibacter sp.]
MRTLKICFLLLLVASGKLIAQQSKSLISGPWAGNIELRNATIWAEVAPSVKSVAVKFMPASDAKKTKTVVYKGTLGNEFNPVKIELNGLDFGTAYNYQLIIDGKPVVTSFPTKFITKDLWQYRKPVPDFSFLTGSCAYFNETVYDRPGKPYGSDSSIFATMAKTPADFHVWLGDNWYTREVDYSTAWGLNYRASRDRSLPILQEFMAKMPHYAIWDDHDYGPNDADKSYILKEESRQVFKNYWLNPSYGENGKGIYSKVNYGDVDLFLTDDRFFRSSDDLPDSVDAKPSAAKTYFGSEQMDWLKNALLGSRATFKIIVTGSQVLNPLNKYECMQHFSYEYNELMNFLAEHKISGILFLTGDRHHSEIIRMDRASLYPLYDITVSPYTSGISKASGIEANNPNREPNTLVEAQNFAKISFSGKKNERTMKVEFIGLKGEKLGEWLVNESALKAGK